jgi:CheY-like chemotaxis protein
MRPEDCPDPAQTRLETAHAKLAFEYFGASPAASGGPTDRLRRLDAGHKCDRPSDTPGMRVRPVVLIVDDTVDQLDLYEMGLADRYTILRATTGHATLTEAVTERPDAIVLDVLMPGEDGFATCARLKGHPVTAGIPVIFLTASDALDVEALAVRAGAAMLLHKPCSVERLSQTIEAAISGRRLPAGRS